MNKAVYLTEIEVSDPDSGGLVTVEIFKDPVSGGMFGVDSSFLEQVSDRVFNPLAGSPIKIDCSNIRPTIL